MKLIPMLALAVLMLSNSAISAQAQNWRSDNISELKNILKQLQDEKVLVDAEYKSVVEELDSIEKDIQAKRTEIIEKNTLDSKPVSEKDRPFFLKALDRYSARVASIRKDKVEPLKLKLEDVDID